MDFSKIIIAAMGDAQWSKRSFNYNYNALSCVGVLIGKVSHKIIHMGFKNKYCK